jgi:hypothetical protein
MHIKALLVASSLALAAGVGCGTSTDAASVDGTMDAAGGALQAGGFHIDVPAGALDHSVTFHVTDSAAPGSIDHGILVDPAGQHFAVPAHVTVDFAQDGLPDVSELFIAHLENGAWQPLHNATQDAGHVTGDLSDTGTLALVHCPHGTCDHIDDHQHVSGDHTIDHIDPVHATAH